MSAMLRCEYINATRKKFQSSFEIWGCAFYEAKEACTHSANAFTMLACNVCA